MKKERKVYPWRKNRLAFRTGMLFFSIPVIAVSLMLIIGSYITNSIADEFSRRLARQYSIEAAANFLTATNSHFVLAQQLAHSTTISRWMAHGYDEEIRDRAIEEVIGYAAYAPYIFLMFSSYVSSDVYDLRLGFTEEDFIPWWQVDTANDLWFVNTKNAELPFNLNIQRSRPVDGYWSPYVWTNHRMYYQGRFVGVATAGSPFQDVFDAVFGDFDISSRRGYIIDHDGLVRVDSAELLKVLDDGLSHPAIMPEGEDNSILADGISVHLHTMRGGAFRIGSPVYDAIPLQGDFRYASIAPIIGTNWSVVVLSTHVGIFDVIYLPMILSVFVVLFITVMVGNLIIRRMALVPLYKLTQSTATLNEINISRNENIALFGLERDDEIGDLARTIYRTLETERDTRDFNQAILDAAPFVIGLWEEDGRPISANNQTMDLFGVPDPKMLTDNLYDFSPEFQPCGTPSPEKASMYYKKAFDEGYVRFEWLNKRLDGELLPVDVVYKTFKRKDRTILLSYTVDLREVKRLENERLEAVEEASRAKSRFLARMSHEIRTPLSAVLGISEIELRNCDMPPRTETAFTKIYESSKTLLQIVNDILDFSKIESGKMSLLVKEYETENLINDVAQLHLIYTEQKNVDFKLHVDASIPLKMKGDVLRIRQIIANLLTNAFKYTESGTVSMSLSCDAGSDGQVILIVCIEDTGMGMTAEQISELKGDYVRFHENEKPLVGGTGLGIPIVYSLAHIMDAQFDIASEVGKGTKATVRVPQEISGAAVLGQDLANNLQNLESKALFIAKDLEFKPEQMPYGKVLVVDDVETNLHVAEAMLESFGLTVELVESGQAAIDKITEGNVYDVIFLDHMMPGMDGLEVAKALRDMDYNLPIVALTANAIKGQAEMFMENGFSGFMTKPIDIKILNSYLVRYVRDKQ